MTHSDPCLIANHHLVIRCIARWAGGVAVWETGEGGTGVSGEGGTGVSGEGGTGVSGEGETGVAGEGEPLTGSVDVSGTPAPTISTSASMVTGM